ncbi:MAG: alpha/beta hydrolase [Chloroflexi bacterium]|nr:alpha/beta hydrolase [Chloroflexota bacterium]MBP6803142.1 alpha/beta hydrolase [Chloroflexota bacterium]MBP7591315.1 alpha/beta hydrolase [Chloroflexota bacterium]
MSITTVGSHLIHYEVLGRGEPLVFIHGWLGSWRYWWPSMQALSSRHRSFAFDLWGFGDSSKDLDSYSLEAYVEMIDQFINQLGIMKPVTLVGHSLGAVAALQYTNKYPANVEKLVTVALPLEGTYMEPRLLDSDPGTILKNLGKANSFQEVDAEVRKTDQTAVNKLATQIAGANLAAALVGCPRPLMMIFGDQDSIVKPPSGDFIHLRRSINNRYYIGLETCHHFPMLQEKAVFNRLLMDFLHNENLDELVPKEYWQRRVR